MIFKGTAWRIRDNRLTAIKTKIPAAGTRRGRYNPIKQQTVLENVTS